ncbi:MAG: hypothetical protein ACREOO_06345 [bacterium]
MRKDCRRSALLFFFLFIPFSSTFAQQRRFLAEHELAPFIGFYAPDRFETSFVFGARYFYNLDRRTSFGAVVGFAHARQRFLRQTSSVVAVPGSERVFFHGARAARTLLTGRVEPYLFGHIGLTKLYDQNSFTFGLGLGTRIFAQRKFVLRYEIGNYIFSSGRDLNKWMNRNVEIALMLGYYL